MPRNDFSRPAARTALVGVLSAGSLALLWLAGIAPSGRLGLAAAAGLFPLAAVLAAGRGAGCLCWAAGSVLGLILLPDKGVAFFGIYPVVKSRLEQLSLWLAWVCKLGYFNAVLALFWFLLRGLFLPSVPAWLSASWMVFALGSAVFVLYDVGLTRLIFGLFPRIAPGGKNRF